MMLTAASTIAGNLTILGAASNIIIIEAAESRGVHSFSFLEFFKVGSIVTAEPTLQSTIVHRVDVIFFHQGTSTARAATCDLLSFAKTSLASASLCFSTTTTTKVFLTAQ
jgi:hypothetical protein